MTINENKERKQPYNISKKLLLTNKTMEFEITNNMRWQPDICRFCLSATGDWDLTVSQTGEIKEVLNDTLKECFGITLSHLSDWGVSRLACNSCVRRLRQAEDFRKQVLEAERRFIQYWRGHSNVPVKIEHEDEPNNFNDSPTFEDDITNHRDDHDTIDKSYNKDIIYKRKKQLNRQVKKTNIKEQKKRKQIVHDNGYDSDTPIAQLSNKNELLDYKNKVENDTNIIFDTGQLEQNNSNGTDIQKVHFSTEGQHRTQEIRQVSERKRVILTCAIVLKDTTACPFRHHKSWFQCFFCPRDFMEINLLRSHTTQTHSNIDDELKNVKRYPRSLQIDISDLKCRNCDLSLSDVETMTRHFESVHQKVVYKECIADYKVDTSPYTCHICKREFHVFRTLTTHLNEHYANCICDVCGKSFLNSKRLKVHKRTHESGVYPCTECGKILRTKTSKANHMESAHSKRVMKCQICLKPMKHYNDRIKHMSEVHNITHKFKCTICDREYNIKHYLATHMRQTHGHKNKKCMECGMAFITNHGLKKHMLKHSGEKPYTCSVCSKSYVRSYTLREHMRVHDTERKVV